MSKIQIHIQQVVGGDKMAYSSDPQHYHQVVKDVRNDLLGLGIPKNAWALRLSITIEEVHLALATPIPGGRTGDYFAAWLSLPKSSLYSIIEGQAEFLLPDLIQKLKSILLSPQVAYAQELQPYLSCELQPDECRCVLRGSVGTHMAYRVYEQEEDLNKILSLLVQDEYSTYSAVYFADRRDVQMQPAGAFVELEGKLLRTYKMRPPQKLSDGVRLFLVQGTRQEVLNQPIRLPEGTAYKLKWQHTSYEDITSAEDSLYMDKINIQEPKPEEWLKQLDLSNVKPTFCGKLVSDAHPQINGATPKEKYSKTEWERGLGLSYKHNEYQGESKSITLEGSRSIQYVFTKRKISLSFFDHYGRQEQDRIWIDNEELTTEEWKGEQWWGKTHSIKVTREGYKEREEKCISLSLGHSLSGLFKLDKLSPAQSCQECINKIDQQTEKIKEMKRQLELKDQQIGSKNQQIADLENQIEGLKENYQGLQGEIKSYTLYKRCTYIFGVFSLILFMPYAYLAYRHFGKGKHEAKSEKVERVEGLSFQESDDSANSVTGDNNLIERAEQAVKDALDTVKDAQQAVHTAKINKKDVSDAEKKLTDAQETLNGAMPNLFLIDAQKIENLAHEAKTLAEEAKVLAIKEKGSEHKENSFTDKAKEPASKAKNSTEEKPEDKGRKAQPKTEKKDAQGGSKLE